MDTRNIKKIVGSSEIKKVMNAGKVVWKFKENLLDLGMPPTRQYTSSTDSVLHINLYKPEIIVNQKNESYNIYFGLDYEKIKDLKDKKYKEVDFTTCYLEFYIYGEDKKYDRFYGRDNNIFIDNHTGKISLEKLDSTNYKIKVDKTHNTTNISFNIYIYTKNKYISRELSEELFELFNLYFYIEKE